LSFLKPEARSLLLQEITIMHMNVESIFQPVTIGPLTAPNRLVRSATAESAGDRNGLPLAAPMSRIYGDLARGGAGLIITGHAFVHPNGRAGAKQSGLCSDAHADAWKPILAALRPATAAPLVCQLSYAARQGYYFGATPPPNDPAQQFPPGGTAFNDFTAQQVENLIPAFADAAARAVAAGFDGVQLHLAHGFLLSECLSAHTNKRSDRWGGPDPANRRRLPLEVVRAVRRKLPADKALLVKLNGSDFLPPDGVEADEAAETAAQLEAAGVHLIEVSCGMRESGAGFSAARPVHQPEEEGYLLPLARAVAARARIPVATVGGYKTTPVILRAIGEGLNMVSLSRALVREPDFPAKIQSGRSHDARCISCNKCFGIAEGALRCLVDHPQPMET
jgi:2,4-dienoyl-CoA reductase-like NADH-dependent reductase (Old Yellow Enzyme family)